MIVLELARYALFVAVLVYGAYAIAGAAFAVFRARTAQEYAWASLACMAVAACLALLLGRLS